MHKATSSLFLFLTVLALAGLANAETFAVGGGTITATRDGANVIIATTGIPAAKLAHFRGQGGKSGSIHVADMKDGKGLLEDVTKNGGRFQLRDASGKWLLITPTNNAFKMAGVSQDCGHRAGCALQVQKAVLTAATAAK